MPTTRSRSRPAPAFPLPLELFTQVGSYLSTNDLITATHVSREWRKVLLDLPTLWSVFDGVDLTKTRAVKRVEAVLKRAKGGLVSLEIRFPPDPEVMKAYFRKDEYMTKAIKRFGSILNAVRKIDGCHNLRRLSVNLQSFRDQRECLFPLVDLLANFCNSHATTITHLSFRSHIDRFPTGQPWFDFLPNLKELTFSTDDDGHGGLSDELPEVFIPSSDYNDDGGWPLPAQGALPLERWTLAGGSLEDLKFAPMPHLTSLKLLAVTVESLSRLLEACAPSLEELWIAETDPERYRTYATGRKVDKILLPKLKTAYVGAYNPPLWVESVEWDRKFVVQTPALEEVSWGAKPRFDRLNPKYLSEYDAFDKLTPELVRKVLKTCPALRTVDVDGPLNVSDADNEAIVDVLCTAGRHLEEVALGTRATEAGVNRLVDNLPELRLLSVEHGSVNLASLARTVQRLASAPPTPLVLRVTRANPSPPSAAELDAALVRALQRIFYTNFGRAPELHLLPAAREEYAARQGADTPGCAGEEELTDELVGLVDAAPKGLPRAAIVVKAKSDEDVLEEVRGEVRRWVGARLDLGAREWLEGQEGVKVECEVGTQRSEMEVHFSDMGSDEEDEADDLEEDDIDDE